VRGRAGDVYNYAITRTFWLLVVADCVSLVAALCMKWNSVKGPGDKKEDSVEA
jgi:hypothetical protein